jgi:hypothetical protein
VAAHAWFENGHRDRRLQKVVLWRLEVAESFGEYVEGPLDGRLYDNFRADHGGC